MVASHDGVMLAARVRGSAPGLVLLHANGFCKEVWDPFLADLGNPDHLAIDQRGHGDSATPPRPIDWWDLGRDVLSVIAEIETATPLTGIGHSSGGAALAMAEILQPGTFARLVLVEPIIVPPPIRRWEENPLAVLTERRRARFPSVDAAFESYRSRPPFGSWDPRALEAYVRHGFEARDGAWVLKCDPRTEAEIYRTAFEHGAWERLDEVQCEVCLVFGSTSQAVSAPLADEMCQRFPNARLEVIEGVGHLIPMEHPQALVDVVTGL